MNQTKPNSLLVVGLMSRFRYLVTDIGILLILNNIYYACMFQWQMDDNFKESLYTKEMWTPDALRCLQSATLQTGLQEARH